MMEDDKQELTEYTKGGSILMFLWVTCDLSHVSSWSVLLELALVEVHCALCECCLFALSPKHLSMLHITVFDIEMLNGCHINLDASNSLHLATCMLKSWVQCTHAHELEKENSTGLRLFTHCPFCIGSVLASACLLSHRRTDKRSDCSVYSQGVDFAPSIDQVGFITEEDAGGVDGADNASQSESAWCWPTASLEDWVSAAWVKSVHGWYGVHRETSTSKLTHIRRACQVHVSLPYVSLATGVHVSISVKREVTGTRLTHSKRRVFERHGVWWRTGHRVL